MQLKNGQIKEIVIDPKSLNINADKFENLIGDDANFNSNKIIEIFKGEDNDFSKAVCLNAAAGLIVSEKFNGLATLARHRLVDSALENMMQTEIHALSIKAQSSDETA